MKNLAKYWIIIVFVIMIVAAAVLFRFAGVRHKKFEQQIDSLKQQIQVDEAAIETNLAYADIQDQIEPEKEKLQSSRNELYSHFSSEFLEEDQINYVLYLEKLFGNEITFSYSDVEPVSTLSDGSYVGGATLTVNFESTRQGFKDIVQKLATDSQIASVDVASVEYSPEDDSAKGTLTITVFTLSASSYEPLQPAGKDNSSDSPKTGEN